MINSVIISGIVAGTPELEQTNSEFSFCKVSLITNKKKQVDGEWEDVETRIPEIMFWGEQAVDLCNNCTQGMRIVINGRIDSDRWEKEAGDVRFFMKIVAQGYEYLPESEEVSEDNTPF